MLTSEARIEANRQNALKSTGPRTEAGKKISRENSCKHGMSGSGIVLPVTDAAEVSRKSAAYEAELKPSGELGRDLVRRAALLAVRMARAVDQQTAALSEHVRQVEAEFEAPEGSDDAEADQLRDEAVRRAMFDPSNEACLARRYEAAAERGFYQALKELRQLKAQETSEVAAASEPEEHPLMGSFRTAQTARGLNDEEFEVYYHQMMAQHASHMAHSPYGPQSDGTSGPVLEVDSTG